MHLSFHSFGFKNWSKCCNVSAAATWGKWSRRGVPWCMCAEQCPLAHHHERSHLSCLMGYGYVYQKFIIFIYFLIGVWLSHWESLCQLLISPVAATLCWCTRRRSSPMAQRCWTWTIPWRARSGELHGGFMGKMDLCIYIHIDLKEKWWIDMNRLNNSISNHIGVRAPVLKHQIWEHPIFSDRPI